MPVLQTRLDARSADFQANAAAMRQIVADLRATVDRIALGGPEAARQKHLARGKLLPRDRVEMLLDPDTPCLEIAPLAALDMYKERDGNDAAPGAGSGKRTAAELTDDELRRFANDLRGMLGLPT